MRDGNGDYITNFYRCSAWRKLSEICMQYLHKGDKITVSGDLALRPFEDKNGVERLSVQLSVTDLELPTAPKAQPQPEPPMDDELPI